VDGQVPWGRDASVIRFCRCPPPSRPALNYMPAYRGQQVYKAALLEHDPTQLEEFIQAAFVAIYEQLCVPGEITPEENQALSEALHGTVAAEQARSGARCMTL
jgi:hypothetical protein